MTMKRWLLVLVGLLAMTFAAGCEEKTETPKAKEAKAQTQGEPAAGEAAATPEEKPEAAPTEQPTDMEKMAEPAAGETAATATLVHQPGAKVGDWTMCPIMKNKFQVKEGQASATYEGQTVYFCCPGCDAKFQEDPAGALAGLRPEIDAHNAALAAPAATE